MQNFDQRINQLEREIYQKQNQVDNLTKTSNIQKQQIEGLINEKEILLKQTIENSTSLESLKQEILTLQLERDSNYQQINTLQQEILQRSKIADVSQISFQLREAQDLITQLQSEKQTLTSQLEHHKFENQRLQEILKIKSDQKLVYIKNDEASDLLKNYETYFQLWDQEKKNLVQELKTKQLQEDKIRLDYQNKYEKLIQQNKQSEDKRKKIEDENSFLKAKLECLKQENEIQLQNQKQYEYDRYINEQQLRELLNSKDKLIQEQQYRIQQLEGRLSQSKSFVLDTVNMILPQHLDQQLELKKQNLEYQEIIQQLKKNNEQLNSKNEKLLYQIEQELPIVIQKKQELEQLSNLSQQLKSKLEIEMKQNQKMKDIIFNLENELQQFRRKIEISNQEIQRLRQENNNHEYNNGNDSYKQNDENSNSKCGLEVLQYFNPSHVKQTEELQQDIISLKLEINRKDEKILILEQKNEILQLEQDVKQVIDKQVLPITHKIEKIKPLSEKKMKQVQLIRFLREKITNLQFQKDQLEFNQTKLEGQLKLEKSSKEFLEKSLKKQKEECNKFKIMYNKREEELEEKFQEIKKEFYQQTIGLNEKNNYYQQNQLLYQKQIEDQQLIQELKKQINSLHQELSQLRQQNTQLQLEKMNQTQNGENEEVLKMRLQIDNYKIQIELRDKQLEQITQKNKELEQENQKFKLENASESLSQFVKEINSANRIDGNTQESISDLRKSLEQQKKKFEQQDKTYAEALQTYTTKFQETVFELNKKIIDLDEENKELIKTLEQYKESYLQEIKKQENRSDLTLIEQSEKQDQYDQLIKERNKLQQLCENYKLEIESNRQLIEKTSQQKIELEEKEKQFEIYQKKTQNEINQELIIKKNVELSIKSNEHILRREINSYKEKLLFEQNKVAVLQKGNNEEMILEEIPQNDFINQNNDLEKQLEEKKAEILKLQLHSRMKIEENGNFEEERQYYEQQIKELKEFKDGITLEDIKLIKQLIQNGKLIAYLEKAKEIMQNQQC